MKKWYQIFPKHTGLSLYVWLLFCILPFYFIFKSSSKLDVALGFLMVLLFFTAYRLSFISKNWLVYIWVSIGMAISIFMTLFFGYIYFALFLAFFIGNIKSKAGFITLYVVHLVTTIITFNIDIFFNMDNFLSQLPFIIICLLGVILLPFTIYNRNKHEQLETLLEDANEKISDLLVMEERQRIARDLHDTLGQKLSLIGLKSDLAGKLIDSQPTKAKAELQDIHQTARTALREVREMVSNMRNVRLKDELIRIKQLLYAAGIDYEISGEPIELKDTTLLIENVLSMCLKEAVTNVVKHSKAKVCKVVIEQSPKDTLIKVHDDGIGISNEIETHKRHGLAGMKERLEFMNGGLEINTTNGTTLTIRIPNVIIEPK